MAFATMIRAALVALMATQALPATIPTATTVTHSINLARATKYVHFGGLRQNTTADTPRTMCESWDDRENDPTCWTDHISPYWNSAKNPPLDSYPGKIALHISSWYHEIRHITLAFENSPYSCEFDLNCTDIVWPEAPADLAEPYANWAVYYPPCLADTPLSIHHGAFCELTHNKYQFDNLWIRYEDQFLNIPTDCRVYDKDEHHKEITTQEDDPSRCMGSIGDTEIGEIGLHWGTYLNADCEFGSYKTKEEVRRVMENPGRKLRGTRYGHPYCDGDLPDPVDFPTGEYPPR